MRFSNFNLSDIVTPIDADELEKILIQTKYNKEKTEYLVNGFHHGFDIGYSGLAEQCGTSENIPIKIGSKTEMWNKVMKEVKMNRYAGLFEQIPFSNFIQSLIGLIPKAGEQKT